MSMAIGPARVVSLVPKVTMINFVCPECAQSFSVGDALSGKKAKCSKCGHVLRIPSITPQIGTVNSVASPLPVSSGPPPINRAMPNSPPPPRVAATPPPLRTTQRTNADSGRVAPPAAIPVTFAAVAAGSAGGGFGYPGVQPCWYCRQEYSPHWVQCPFCRSLRPRHV
jgi:predicted Zn finger-like uncharacterized protein